jgi:AsmA-like C-terminal region
MYRFHLARNLRSLFFLLVVGGFLALCGALWWANRTGLPKTWRGMIEREISKQGAYVTIGGLSYNLLRGVVASDVHVFADPEHQRELSNLEGVILDFDKSKLARGIVHLTKIELVDADLMLPVNPKDPKGQVLTVTDVYGTILMPGERRLELSKTRGKIAGIDVKIDAQIFSSQLPVQPPPDESNEGKKRELFAKIINELGKWHFSQKTPPLLEIHLEGDATERASLIANLRFSAVDIEKNGHKLDTVDAEIELRGDLVTVNTLTATDTAGELAGHIDYNLLANEGRFDLSSSLEIPKMLKAWLGLATVKDIAIRGRQILEAEGSFQVAEDQIPQVQMTGHVRCDAVSLRGMPFEYVESAFSWRDGSFFLKDIQLNRGDGKARGKAMIRWPKVQLVLTTTLPVPVYRPFFVGQPLEIVLNDFSERKGAQLEVKLDGGFDVTDKHSWYYSGSGHLKNHSYKGVPVNDAECAFTLNHQQLDFHDGTVVFNYDNYALQKAFNGPKQATAKVGRIRFDAATKLVHVEAVNGEFWAAPLVRFFAPKIADLIEPYRFHQPPELRGAGVVDVTPQGRTSLDVTFTSKSPADYVFLGENLTLQQPQAKVAIRGERVSVNDLKLEVFDGAIAGRCSYLGNGKIEGEFSWNQLSIPKLTTAYGFKMKGGGSVTGRIAFGLNNNEVDTMSGDGLMAMEKAELFSVPLFGPLTPLIGTVLNDNTAGTQQARNAFFTFKIDKGVLSSNDFKTSTTSLNFTGDGSINLKDREIDILIRMNARGLLGLLTLPLRPFYGLFQFHGTGPLKNPEWKNVGFNATPEAQNALLAPPPKATIIAEDR